MCDIINTNIKIRTEGVKILENIFETCPMLKDVPHFNTDLIESLNENDLIDFLKKDGNVKAMNTLYNKKNE